MYVDFVSGTSEEEGEAEEKGRSQGVGKSSIPRS